MTTAPSSPVRQLTCHTVVIVAEQASSGGWIYRAKALFLIASDLMALQCNVVECGRRDTPGEALDDLLTLCQIADITTNSLPDAYTKIRSELDRAWCRVLGRPDADPPANLETFLAETAARLGWQVAKD